MSKHVSVEEIEQSETLLDTLMEELDKDHAKVIYLSYKKGEPPVAVMVHPENEVYKMKIDD